MLRNRMNVMKKKINSKLHVAHKEMIEQVKPSDYVDEKYSWGGGYFKFCMMGVCGLSLEVPHPIHIKAKPDNHTFSYIFF